MVKRIIEIEKLVKNEEARESRISLPASRERESWSESKLQFRCFVCVGSLVSPFIKISLVLVFIYAHLCVQSWTFPFFSNSIFFNFRLHRMKLHIVKNQGNCVCVYIYTRYISSSIYLI